MCILWLSPKALICALWHWTLHNAAAMGRQIKLTPECFHMLSRFTFTLPSLPGFCFSYKCRHKLVWPICVGLGPNAFSEVSTWAVVVWHLPVECPQLLDSWTGAGSGSVPAQGQRGHTDRQKGWRGRQQAWLGWCVEICFSLQLEPHLKSAHSAPDLGRKQCPQLVDQVMQMLLAWDLHKAGLLWRILSISFLIQMFLWVFPWLICCHQTKGHATHKHTCTQKYTYMLTHIHVHMHTHA